MDTKNNKMTYFLYARKSSESEDRQVQSIDDQINRLKELAGTLNIRIKEILTEAQTAKKPYCRPVFAKMLERIEHGEADGILCWEINRLSRNPIDSGKISWMLQQGILKSIQTIDRQYLPDDNILLFNVESGMANQFIIDLRKNSKRGMEGKAGRGWLPARAPMGYMNDRLEKSIGEDPERFHLVRKMWDMMLTGNHTPVQIKNIANKEWGFRTPKKKRTGDVELSTSGIYKMFSNLFYTGSFEWAGTLYQGHHKPMITLEEFDRVQVLLGRKGKPRPKQHEFAFTGLIKCAECGSMYTATNKTKIVKSTGELKSYIYYHCTRRKTGAKNCSQRKTITLEEMEKQIEQELERNTILPKFQSWALEILNRENDKEIEDRTKIYEMQHSSVVQTQKELDNLTRMRYREQVDEETYVRERNLLQSQISKLKSQLRETESRAEKWIELTEKTFVFATYARKEFVLGGIDRKKEIFSALGQNFFVKDQKLQIQSNSWLVPIKEQYPALEAEYNRLELNKTLSNKAKTEALSSVLTRWRPHGESNSDYQDENLVS